MKTKQEFSIIDKYWVGTGSKKAIELLKKGLHKFHVGYKPECFNNDHKKWEIKGSYKTKKEADAANLRLSKRREHFGEKPRRMFKGIVYCPIRREKFSGHLYYEVLSSRKVLEQWNECTEKSKERRKKTVAKHAGRKKTFILCPRCKSTSKLLYSEMGGLQTRRCTRCEHQFEYDKWIGDRLGMAMIFGNPVAAVKFASQNPVVIR